MKSTFPSQRDLWLTLLVAASAVATAAMGVVVWWQPVDPQTRLVVTGLCIVTSLFIVDLLLRTSYTLSPECLRVRCGVFLWQVPCSAIESVHRSRTWISGPALSLDRLVIQRSDSRLPLIISPIDPQRFLAELAAHDPALQQIGDELQRQDNGLHRHAK